ncbi:MAG: ion transporter, partial [Bacteroidota bacterium]
EYKDAFWHIEWVVTILFSVEYGLRLYSAPSAKRYALSFYGIVDLLSILPTFFALVFTGAQYLTVIRIVRLLRVFRILKLTAYLVESRILAQALRASRRKITVFLGAVLTVVVIIGSIMYFIEADADSGFTSIPRGMYWAIVTVTTVGYGDIAPKTTMGQFLSAILMIIGYGVLAVPTGIVSVEIAQATSEYAKTNAARMCQECNQAGHDPDAHHCKWCGAELPEIVD